MKHSSTILMTEFVTHDVKRFILTKPRNFDYKPGQGVKMVIIEPEWRKEERFYICGPDSFVEEIKSLLKKLGASPKSLVFEK